MLHYLGIKILLFSVFGFLLIATILKLVQLNELESITSNFEPVDINEITVPRTIKAYVYLKNNLKQWMYSEVHKQSWKNQKKLRSSIIISDRQGKQIGKKILNFNSGKYTPSFRLWDFRNGNYESVERLSEKSFLLKYRKHSKATLKIKKVTVDYLPIVDSGFEQFIRDHWETLQNKSMKIDFAIPAQLLFITISIRYVQNEKNANILFELVPDSAFLRLFIKPIRLLFDKQKMVLLNYQGPYSFFNEKGQGMKVQITYSR